MGIVSPLGGLVASVLPPQEGGYDGTLRGVCHPALFSGLLSCRWSKEVKGLDWIDEPSIRIDDRRIRLAFYLFFTQLPSRSAHARVDRFFAYWVQLQVTSLGAHSARPVLEYSTQGWRTGTGRVR